MNKWLAAFIIAGAAVTGASSQTPRTLTATMPAKVANRTMQPLEDGPRRGIKLDAREGDGVAWWPDVTVGDATIDVDLRGKDVAQQSFIGVAFHGVDDKTFDAV